MRKVLTLLLATMAISNAYTQNNVVNGNFESWNDSTSYSEPKDWNTSNEEYIFVGATVERTDDAYSGDSAAVVKTVYSASLDEYYAGYLTVGKNPDTISLDGWQISYRPEKLTGYYKYSSPTLGDSARVILYMYQENPLTNRDSLVATGNKLLSPAVDYTYFEFDILNAFSGTTTPVPDSYVIVFTSSKDVSSPVEGLSMLTVDNLNFEGAVSAPTLADLSDVSIYPNPVDDHFVVSSPKYSLASISIINAEGRQVQFLQATPGTNDLRVTTNRLSKGFYFVRLQFENGAVETRFITVTK